MDAPATQTPQIRNLWSSTAEILPVLGAIFFGTGWIFFAGLGDVLDVNPEAMGVTFGFLLPRVALSLGLFTLFAMGIILYTWEVRGRTFLDNGYRDMWGWFTGGLVACTVLATSGFVIVQAILQLWSGGRVGATLLVSSSVMFVLWLGITWRIAIKASARKISYEKQRYLLTFVVAALVLPLFGSMWVAGRAVGTRVQAGIAVDLIIVRFPSVRYADREGRSFEGCAILLGNDGSSYLLVSRTRTASGRRRAETIRAPIDYTTIEYRPTARPCGDG